MDNGPRRQSPELLAPAGGPDALAAALAGGADAVYVGLGSLNARAANGGFSPRELARGCALAHARGARVYVTLNVAVRDGELEGAVALGRAAVDVGADALIVADAGLCRRLRAEHPGIELHLSTQAGAMSASAVRVAARELDVARVTCARELSVDELAELVATGVPIEAFCHGAICICYSGACSYSAARRGRSAMRGDCTQPCRMAYELRDGAGSVVAGGHWRAGRSRGDAAMGDRLLCPRDYLGIRHLPELVDARIASLKIEGRMKNPDYVYNVVSCYRAALDAIAEGHDPHFDALEERLSRSFNRGFTDAYLTGAPAATGRGLMSFERAINQGLRVGRVRERCHEEVLVALDRAVCAGDTFEIRSTPASDAPSDVPKRWPMVPCPRDAAAGERLAVRCKRVVEVGSDVHVVRSEHLIEEATRAVEAVRAAGGGVAPASEDPRDSEPAPTWPEVVRPGHRDAAVATRRADAPPLPGPVVAAWRLAEDGPAVGLDLSSRTVVLDEVCRVGDEGLVRELCRRAGAIVCRNIGQLDIVAGSGVPWGAAPPIAVWNASTVGWLRGMGASWVWTAAEPREGVSGSDGAWEPAGVDAALAATPLMITEHCLLTAEGPCAHDCARCERRAAAARGERLLVELDRGSAHGSLPVRVDARGRTRIFDESWRTR